MKIIQVNKFHYPRGGADKYFLSLSRALEAAGHKVAVFAMEHPKNLPSPWSRFFVSRLSFNEGGLKDRLRTPGRVLYSREAKRKFAALIEEFKPDIIHIHNIYHQLSPSILSVARQRAIPVVMHCHDYKLICPNYQLFVDGKICERCLGHRYYNCLAHRCLKKSFSHSLLATAEAYLHHSLKTYEKSLARLIAPSAFLKAELIKGGWPEGKVSVIYNPSDPEFEDGSGAEAAKGGYLLYFGRLSPEKGLETLIAAAAETGQKAKIAGTGPEEGKLRKLALDLEAPIEFLGFQNPAELKKTIREAKAVIIPSLWPENMPLSLLESLSLGKIVIVSRVGGLPELVRADENGFLFAPGDVRDLAEQIRKLEDCDQERMQLAAKRTAANFTLDQNLRTIIDTYNHVLLKSND